MTICHVVAICPTEAIFRENTAEDQLMVVLWSRLSCHLQEDT